MTGSLELHVVGEGYAQLSSLADLGLMHLAPHSQEAKDALVDFARKLNAKYSETTGAPSEYAVGFVGAKPAFEGEKALIGKFVALVARAGEYREDHPFEFMGYGYWTERDSPLLKVKRVEL